MMNLVACKRCKKMISVKTTLCPHCNMIKQAPSTKEKALCPECKVALVSNIYRKRKIDVCPTCQGIWLDTLDFQHLTCEKDVYNDPDIDPDFAREALIPKVGYRECVRCEQMMNRVNFRNMSGVVIDICSPHGIWLDKGELKAMRNFIATGGLDKSQDMEIFKNKDKIERLSDSISDVEYMQRVLHMWSFKRIILSGGKFFKK